MKTPMKLHGWIVATNFVPYYLAEAMGITIPMFGLSSLDPTTAEWSPMVLFTYLFVAHPALERGGGSLICASAGRSASAHARWRVVYQVLASAARRRWANKR